MSRLTHLDETGAARMVDVGHKQVQQRSAEATGLIRMDPGTGQAIREGQVRKGDVLAVARIAGIQAAKNTSGLIPLCHPLAVTSVDISIERVETGARITSRVGSTGPTEPIRLALRRSRPTPYVFRDSEETTLFWSRVYCPVHREGSASGGVKRRCASAGRISMRPTPAQ